MKKCPLIFANTTFVCMLLAVVALVSCKSNSPLFPSKHYKLAIKQRDSLRTETAQLKNDTSKIGKALREAQIANAALKEKYGNLENSSGEKLGKLSSDLDIKSNELARKENLLKEQERKLREMQAIVAKQDSITNRLNQIVKDALLGFQSDELSVNVKNGKVYVSMTDKLLFKSGKASVEAKGQEAIQKLSAVLNKNPEIDVFIEGHTDNVPIKTDLYKDNWDLSVARATNIVRMLTDNYHMDPKRLTASGKGEYFPVAPNDTPENKAKNRRTEIVLSPKLDELFGILQKKN